LFLELIRKEIFTKEELDVPVIFFLKIFKQRIQEKLNLALNIEAARKTQ
jgi:hypothetical protein